MATIQVIRGDGSREGQDIFEPILSDTVLLTRGTAEIDANSTQFNDVTLSIVYREGVRLGQLVQVSDPLSPNGYRAKITGISFDLTHGDASMTLNLARPV